MFNKLIRYRSTLPLRYSILKTGLLILIIVKSPFIFVLKPRLSLCHDTCIKCTRLKNQIIVPKNPDPILNLIERYENHPSILATKRYGEQYNYWFCLEYITKEKVNIN